MDGIDGGLLDAMGQLQKLSAVDPVPMMKAKKNPLHRGLMSGLQGSN
jgi:hypothetical protein